MHSKFVPVLAIAIFAAAGCSGGHKDVGAIGPASQTSGDSSSTPGCGTAIFDPVPVLNCASLPTVAPAAGVDAMPGGYWSGQFLDETQAVQGYMSAMVGEDGRFQLWAYRYNDTNTCTNWEAEFGGNMTTVGNSLSGSGRMIALKPTLADGTMAADLQIEGVVVERDSLTGTWNASSGDAGCFQMNQYWATDYEAPSALENLVGEWNDYYSESNSHLTVDVDGSIIGSDRYGCSWTGLFGLIDDHYSLYEFEAELQSCDRAGHYTGLAWHGWGWDPGEFWLEILADDGEQALRLTFSSL